MLCSRLIILAPPSLLKASFPSLSIGDGFKNRDCKHVSVGRTMSFPQVSLDIMTKERNVAFLIFAFGIS